MAVLERSAGTRPVPAGLVNGAVVSRGLAAPWGCFSHQPILGETQHLQFVNEV
jgi:hypothetical protein